MLIRLVPLLLFLLVAVSVYLLVRQGRPETLRPRPALRGPGVPADPTARHTGAVAAARELVQHAEAAHGRAVAAAQERLTEAGLDLPVMTLGGLRLGRLSLVAAERERWLTPATRFAVDVQGQVRWDPVEDEDGRLRIEADDRREVRLAVEDPGWAEHVTLPGDHVDEASRFVAAGKAVVRSLGEARAARQRRIAAALADLAAARADTAELDRARMTLEDLEGAGPLRGDLPPAPDDPDETRGGTTP